MSRAVLLVASFCLAAGWIVETSFEEESSAAGGGAEKDGSKEEAESPLFATWATCTWGVSAVTTAKPFSTKEVTHKCFLSTDATELGILGKKSNVFIVDFAGDDEVWSMPTFGGYSKLQDLPIKETLRRVSGKDPAGSKINYPDWMAQLKPPEGTKTITVGQLNVPGSHDAVCVTDGSGGWTDQIATTQTKSLTEQLDAGFRWFDVRFALKNGVWTAVHPNAVAKGSLVCPPLSHFYKTAEFYIDEVSKWLEMHKEEIVFLRIKPACGTDRKLLDQIQTCDKEGKSLGCLFDKAPTYRSDKPPTDRQCCSLAGQDIREMRGKMVPLIYSSEFRDTDVNFNYWKYTSEYSGKASLKLSYSDTLKIQQQNWEKRLTNN